MKMDVGISVARLAMRGSTRPVSRALRATERLVTCEVGYVSLRAKPRGVAKRHSLESDSKSSWTLH